MSPTLTIEVIRLVRAGGTFAPVNIPLMRQASEQARDHLDPPSNQFTPRQLLVLEHLQRGSANKIIAHELALSEGTVKVHVRNIMKKLRATNRTQAVSRSYKLMSGGEVAEVTARAAWRAPEVGQATSP
jgi:DNA-binding NarL/FixJ family response regulator